MMGTDNPSPANEGADEASLNGKRNKSARRRLRSIRKRAEEPVEIVPAGLMHADTPQHPPTRDAVIKARQEAIMAMSKLKIELAQPGDAEALAELYHSLRYDPQAFRTLAAISPSEFQQIMKLDPRDPRRRALMMANNVFRGGGVFSPTKAKEWKRRIKTDGEVVMVLRDESGKPIGVHSYFRGKTLPDEIMAKVEKMSRNMTTEGRKWLQSLLSRNSMRPFEKVYMIRDSMLSRDIQGQRVILKFSIEMMEHEIREGHLQRDELSDVNVMFYVNHFHDFTLDPEEHLHDDQRILSMGIQSNQATVNASRDAGAYQIGTTLPDEDKKWTVVKDLDNVAYDKPLRMDPEDESSPIIYASIGDQDYVVPVGAKLVEYLKVS